MIKVCPYCEGFGVREYAFYIKCANVSIFFYDICNICEGKKAIFL